MVTLEKVNSWAKKSCPRWNKNKLSRRRYRDKYRATAADWIESPEGQKTLNQYRNGVIETDTYPWPYREPGFANWDEDDSDDGYSLISDPSGCVVKYATSYCAWKIYELTKSWPQKTSAERLDAKRWQQFLAEAGYPKVVDRPDPGHHYVGIKPDEGEWGLVVWFETDDPEFSQICVSSYIDKAHKIWWTSSADFTWVQID